MGGGISSWNAGKVIQETNDKVKRNMEVAAKIVEMDSRRRLLAIQAPGKGRERHRAFVAGLMDSEVEVRGKEVRGRVGPRATSHSRYYGFYIEFGSRKFPAPNPFLRPALESNKGAILAALATE